MIQFYVIAEDWLSIYVIRKIISTFPNDFSIIQEDCKNGFGAIKRDIEKYNQAAKTMPFFILTDLDNDNCPSEKIQSWFKYKPLSKKMFFRIAVKEIESWILADRKGIASYLNIAENNIGKTPDKLDNPKEEIFRLVKKCRNKNIREAIIPIKGSSIAPAYNSTLHDFLHDFWDISRARENSPSLRKTIEALEEFKVIT